MDFGISGVNQNNLDKKEIGSVKYMAPELFDKNFSNSIGYSIDVWSIGIILFALVTGRLPFNGENNSEIIEKVFREDYQFNSNEE